VQQPDRQSIKYQYHFNIKPVNFLSFLGAYKLCFTYFEMREHCEIKGSSFNFENHLLGKIKTNRNIKEMTWR